MATGSIRSIAQSLGSASSAVDIDDALDHPVCNGVYIGTSGTWHFDIDATEVVFNLTEAGTILPIRATKATTNGTVAPTSGDIIFLY
tara:strand:+ start:593 stop:853 length:261 start_codon:yes stop_codon:yes gene_type:complete